MTHRVFFERPRPFARVILSPAEGGAKNLTIRSGQAPAGESRREDQMGVVLIVLAIVIIDLIVIYLFLRFVWFYRDPVRVPPEKERVVISPADGQIVYIKKIEKNQVFSEKLGTAIDLKEVSKLPVENGQGWIIGIYMSPLDVHFNYAPVAGKVERIAYTKAKMNLPMADLLEYVSLAYLRRTVDNFAKKFHFENERNTILIEGKDFPVAVVEIADKFVNKIKCFVKEGQSLDIGEKIGFVDRGSQVDLIIFHENLNLRVSFGDQVYGGKTILAEY
jgi:phosphatidylserine decarboxylase